MVKRSAFQHASFLKIGQECQQEVDQACRLEKQSSRIYAHMEVWMTDSPEV
ncbi:hypothetical protein [Chryseobacterium angstadtii]|uniref:hypothetical protein n=1 Tax=Chryseobacterium angstadtii TaxID=558151 RepID=UPI0012FEE4A2|nr:hypothetical protein [Chryseobacterium angstadtii]